jgi:hypothetical protein
MTELDIGNLNIEKVQALIEVSPKMKLKYVDGEAGWAYDIGHGLAIIGNVPAFADHIGILDVVNVVEDSTGRPTAGPVVWMAYGATSGVEYPKSDAKTWYRSFRQATEALGMRAEGMIEGLAIVCHGENINLRQVLKDARVRLSGVGITTCIRRRPGEPDEGGVPVYTQGLTFDLQADGSYDVVELGKTTEARMLEIARALPVTPADPDACPPAVGFSEPPPSKCGNVCRTEDGTYFILPGGSGEDAFETRKATLPEVETWIHEKFEQLGSSSANDGG